MTEGLSESLPAAAAASEAERPGPPTFSTPARRWAWWALVAGVVLVHVPALRTPFFLDDYVQIAMADGTYPGRHGALDLYDFISDSNRHELLDMGVFPWWTDPSLVVRFLRPLSSLLLWADHKAFGRIALLFHLHSLLWWALASVGVHLLYRCCFSKRVTAVLATTAFALSRVVTCCAPRVDREPRGRLVSGRRSAPSRSPLIRCASGREKWQALDGLARPRRSSPSP